MFCPDCGSQVPDDSRFCPSCGSSFGGATPTPGASAPQGAPVTPPVPGQVPVPYAAPAPEMKWYKFLIYFSLFAGALLSLGNGLMAFMGMQYQGDAEFVYAMFSQVRIIDIVYGIVLIAFAAAMIYVRQQLAGFKKGAPQLFLLLCGAELAASVIYNGALVIIVMARVSPLLPSYISPLDFASEFISFYEILGYVIGVIIYIVLNKVYFDKRASLFTN